MKKFILLLLTAIGSNAVLKAQGPADSNYLISLNQLIDNNVVKQDTAALKTVYAEDFVFSHGSGRVEGKQGWMRSVAKGGFLLRQHDSVTVELHPALAILKGKLSVQKQNKEKTDRYHLKYIRVYAFRNKQWMLVSHVTTDEWHEK
ncbi:MAG TPA: nuclear transport factor 2 family protein [Chitinophagaceae bacterium]|jgi:hypothetical protein|nr:nuclear transport factor 2 family protein [Chitinophagaceae bacterium]